MTGSTKDVRQDLSPAFVSSSDGLSQRLRPYIPFTALHTVWGLLDQGTTSILDVGCGRGGPMSFLRSKLSCHAVGVDAYLPYLLECQKRVVYQENVRADVRCLPFSSKSFDVVLCMEVLEHLEKEEGHALLAAMEEIARRQVILTTPLGRHEQHEYDGNKHQEHKHIWEPRDLRRLGYRTIGHGMRGLGGLSGVQSPLPTFLHPLVNIAWVLAGPLARIHTEWGGNMVALKELSG